MKQNNIKRKIHMNEKQPIEQCYEFVINYVVVMR